MQFSEAFPSSGPSETSKRKVVFLVRAAFVIVAAISVCVFAGSVFSARALEEVGAHHFFAVSRIRSVYNLQTSHSSTYGVSANYIVAHNSSPRQAENGARPLEDGLFSPYGILPSQFFSLSTSALWTPEKRLLFAVLQDAVDTYFRNLPQQTRRQKNIFNETAKWFASFDSDRLMSFETICAHLGLDAEYIRLGIKRLEENNRQPIRYNDRSVK